MFSLARLLFDRERWQRRAGGTRATPWAGKPALVAESLEVIREEIARYADPAVREQCSSNDNKAKLLPKHMQVYLECIESAQPCVMLLAAYRVSIYSEGPNRTTGRAYFLRDAKPNNQMLKSQLPRYAGNMRA